MKPIHLTLGLGLTALTFGAVTFFGNPYKNPTIPELPNSTTLTLPLGTDASVAINDAIDRIRDNPNYPQETGTGTVYLPRGVYLIKNPIHLTSGIRLQGAGAYGNPVLPEAGQGTIFVCQPSTAGDFALVMGSDPPDIVTAKNAVVSGIKFVGTAGQCDQTIWGGAIKVLEAKSCTIEDIAIEGFYEDPAVPDSPFDPLTGAVGILVEETLSSTIRNCRFEDCNAFIWFKKGDVSSANSNTVTANKFGGGSDSAIYSTVSHDIKFYGNWFDGDVGHSCLYMDGSNTWSILFNRFTTTLDPGDVHVAFSDDPICYDHNVFGNYFSDGAGNNTLVLSDNGIAATSGLREEHQLAHTLDPGASAYTLGTAYSHYAIPVDWQWGRADAKVKVWWATTMADDDEDITMDLIYSEHTVGSAGTGESTLTTVVPHDGDEDDDARFAAVFELPELQSDTQYIELRVQLNANNTHPGQIVLDGLTIEYFSTEVR